MLAPCHNKSLCIREKKTFMVAFIGTDYPMLYDECHNKSLAHFILSAFFRCPWHRDDDLKSTLGWAEWFSFYSFLLN